MDMRSLLTLSVFLALIKEDKGLTVKLLPRYPQVYAGDDVTLQCSGGDKETQWFINNTRQSNQKYLLLLTTVSVTDNGAYVCEQNGTRSDTYTLTVLALEPHAQLSPAVGGAVMTKGDARNLVLQVEDGLEGWRCFVLRKDQGFIIQLDKVEKNNRAVIYADLKDAERATFWCKKHNTCQRSNAVTLKMTELKVMLEPPAAPALKGEPVALRCVVWGGGKVKKATFFKDGKEINGATEETYNITSAQDSDTGTYKCTATFSYIHVSVDATEQKYASDAQEIKVIAGAPAAFISESGNSLWCSCPDCPTYCRSYHWYHTPLNDQYTSRKLSANEWVTIEDFGEYSCRKKCNNSFSRFSHKYKYAQPEAEPDSNLPSIVAVLVVLGLVMLLLSVILFLCRRRMEGNAQVTERDKGKQTGGDYEQLALSDKAVYHTLGQSTGQDKAEGEGGYEALQKKAEEGVYHTLGPGEAQAQAEGQGGYEALKNVKAEVYQTLGSGEAQAEGQGGYEALKNVKAEVYQKLSSAESEKPAGEAEGGYEQLPQKDKDYETVEVEENPYEELKAEKQKSKEKENP